MNRLGQYQGRGRNESSLSTTNKDLAFARDECFIRKSIMGHQDMGQQDLYRSVVKVVEHEVSSQDT